MGSDHPDTLTTRHEIARLTAARGDHTAAETEYRDILTAETRVLGAEHPSTKITRRSLDELLEQKDAAVAPGGQSD